MATNKLFTGGLFEDDCTLLFFIILFLLLFCGYGGLGKFGYRDNPVDAGLNID
jgi:hypothetical protein